MPLPLVYLLDDDPTIHMLLERVLVRLGFDVEASSLWSELSRDLARANAAETSMLVCDLNLPGIRGEDFCRTVLKHNPAMQIVLYTGVPREEAQAAAERLGGLPFVTKREGPERLAEVLKECTQRLGSGLRPAERSPTAPGGKTPRATSVYLVGGGLPGPIEVGRAPIVFGRGTSADVVLNCDQVSRRHLSVQRVEGGVRLQDLGSANGTTVNGAQVAETKVVTSNVEVAIGSCSFVVCFGLTAREAAERHGEVAQGATRVLQRPKDPMRITTTRRDLRRHDLDA